MNLFALLPLTGFLLSLSAVIYIIKKGPGRFFNWLLALSILALSFVELANFMAFLSAVRQTKLFWMQCSIGGLLLVSIFWILFSLIFGRANYKALLSKWSLYPAFLVLGTLWFFNNLLKGSIITSEIEQISQNYGFGLTVTGRYLFAFSLLSLVVILLNFENIYRLSRHTQRKKIKYFIRGIVIALSSYIILTSLAVLFSYLDIRFTLVSSLALSCGIILVIYSVSRYGVTDFDIRIKRQALYTSATLTIIGFYLLTVGIVVKLFMKSGLNLNSFFSFLSALFIFLLFLGLIFSKTLREKLRLFIDRAFYKDTYDYRREWKKFSDKTSSIFNLEELLKSVTRGVCEIMNIKNSSIILLDDNKAKFSPEIIDWLWRHSGPLEIKKIANEGFRRELESLNVPVCVPLITKQRLLGVLNVGEKSKQQKFTPEDFELLKMISSQTAIAIANVRLSESLIAAREMESFYKISSFLIHDLKNFASMLSMVVQNAKDNFDKPEFRKDALITMSNTVGKMNGLIQRLSLLPKELELKPRLTDLGQLAMDVFAALKIEDNKQIRLVNNLNGLPKLMLDSEYIEKVFLNLMLNAAEAIPQGGEIKISSHQNKDFVELSLSDSGCGMSQEFIDKQLFKPFQSTKNKGLGIGLFQCKTIVEAHKGRIDVQSKVGEGTTFTIRFPINGAK